MRKVHCVKDRTLCEGQYTIVKESTRCCEDSTLREGWYTIVKDSTMCEGW